MIEKTNNNESSIWTKRSLYTLLVGVCTNPATMGIRMKAFYKIKLDLRYDSAVLHLSIYSKGSKLTQHRYTCTSKYIAAPFTKMKWWIQPLYVPSNRGRDQTCGACAIGRRTKQWFLQENRCKWIKSVSSRQISCFLSYIVFYIFYKYLKS